MSPAHWVALSLAVASAAVFAAIGLIVLRRTAGAEPHVRLATIAFSSWWFAVAAQETIDALRVPLAAAELPLSVFVGLQSAALAAVTLGLAALLYYLLFVLTGRSLVSWPILLGYCVYFGWLVQHLAHRSPIAYEDVGGSVSIVYRLPLDSTEVLALVLGLAGPQLVAVAGLLMVAARLPRGAARIRTMITALGLAAWFSTSIAATVVGEDPMFAALADALPLIVGITVLLAYRPPPWLEARMQADPPTRLPS